MMMSSLRKEVLQCFKKIHKTSLYIFNEDRNALHMARIKINEEFKKNKTISDEKKIKELVKYGQEVEHELRTTVIQAVEVKPGSYEAKIRPETLKLDNIPFNDKAITEGCPGKSV